MHFGIQRNLYFTGGDPSDGVLLREWSNTKDVPNWALSWVQIVRPHQLYRVRTSGAVWPGNLHAPRSPQVVVTLTDVWAESEWPEVPLCWKPKAFSGTFLQIYKCSLIGLVIKDPLDHKEGLPSLPCTPNITHSLSQGKQLASHSWHFLDNQFSNQQTFIEY